MKKLLLSFVIMPAALMVSGQGQPPVSSGKITYEERVKMEIKLEGEAAQLAQNLPKERKSEKILMFAEDVILYQDGVNNAEDEMMQQHGEGQVRIRMVAGSENKLYADLRNNVLTEQKDFMNRMFIVEKQIPKTDWKVTGNQKKILGYDCYEAVKQDTGRNRTIVWFAPGIPVKGGPAGICNLPGMVLEADLDSGSRTYIAKSVEAVSPDVLKIQKPKEGKKVTEEEYRTIVAEKMKEMGIEEGTQGGNQVRIVIRHQ
jgi:GLPGLI family protein